VLERALIAWYLPTGHLLFGRGHTVYAVPFNSKTFETTGSEVPVLSDVELNAGGTARNLPLPMTGRSSICPDRAPLIDAWPGSRPMERSS
ncbi:MAG: hypothetical protein KAJ78_10295, partial [Acidobacteria bacterium]|nr:hypothetical protein [Acidobacteriota bacterium]